MDEAKLLALLKQARTALKIEKPDVALERIRAAINILELETPPPGSFKR